MKTAFPMFVMAFVAVTALAEQKQIAEYSWQALADAGQVKSGTVVTLPDKSVALKIENTGSAPLMATVLVIENPKVTGDFYSLSGDVRYEGVEGDGFLEMWNHFGEAAYFSRTMGDTGPMGKLRGTSDWRPFILPFNATGTKSRPTKLVVNVHLPAKGVVYLRSPLKLAESSEKKGESGSVQPGAWWSDRTGNLAAAILGSIIGVLGGLIGWLGARGKARFFVLGTVRTLIVIGVVATAAGLIALTVRQPYAVWCPLLLIGVISVVVFPLCLRHCADRYREIELRRMTSMDVA